MTHTRGVSDVLVTCTLVEVALGEGGGSYINSNTVVNTGQRRKQHHQHKLLIVVERLLALKVKTNQKGNVIMTSLCHVISMYKVHKTWV